MVELKLSYQWKERIIGWMRDLILILGMWSIWLIHDYMPDERIMIILTWFIGTMIALVVLIKEYIVSIDSKILEFDRELEKIKKS